MPTEAAEPNRRARSSSASASEKRASSGVGHLVEQLARLVDAFYGDGAETPRIPCFEEALEDFVDEPAARPGRQHRLVLGRFFQLQHVGGEKLERAILVAFKRAERVRRHRMTGRRARAATDGAGTTLR